MRIKYFYYAVVQTENGKSFAHAEKVPTSTNLANFFGNESVIIVQPTATLKEAKELADFWNGIYKRDGRYLYDFD